MAELRKGRRRYRRQSAAAQAAHADADRALREAHRLDCAAWSSLQFIGRDASPSPVIADAIHGGCELLEVHRQHCNHTDVVDLTLSIWPRGNQVHTLKGALYCRPCMKEHGKKRRPDLVGLRERRVLTRARQRQRSGAPDVDLDAETACHWAKANGVTFICLLEQN